MVIVAPNSQGVSGVGGKDDGTNVFFSYKGVFYDGFVKSGKKHLIKSSTIRDTTGTL